MNKPLFANNQIYHIYNRGVEKRVIFNNDKDRLRFIHCLFDFNDVNPSVNNYYYLNKSSEFDKYSEVGPRYIKKPRKLLVELSAFCLMPNHFHLLLKQKVENGIVKFMHKLGTGYAMYFNKKHERVGPLFQGKFKAVLVSRDEYFKYLPYYIHLNPLDLVMSEWRKHKIKDYNKAIKFLNQYRWSSYLDYTGLKNFPSVTQRDFLVEFIGKPIKYRRDTENWLKDNVNNWAKLSEFIISEVGPR